MVVSIPDRGQILGGSRPRVVEKGKERICSVCGEWVDDDQVDVESMSASLGQS